MTISSTVRKAGPYTGNDVAVSFPFAFKVFADTDVLAVRTVISTGVESTVTTGYTVTRNADQDANPGGTVVLSAALASTDKLTLASQVPYSQPTLVTNLGAFYPSVINDALDRVTILTQQLKEGADRSLKLAISSSAAVSAALPAPVALSYLGWSADGLSLVNYSGLASVGVSAFMTPVVALATAPLVRTALGAASLGANTFTGAQTLPGNAVNPLEAVPKQQAESIASAAAASAVSNRMQYSLTASQATTSGVAVDFTGIPSWASRITVLFDGVSTNGTDNVAIRIGTSAGVEASGYLGTTLYYLGTSNGAAANIGTGISIFLGANTIFRSGALTLTRMSGNRWAFAGMIVDTVGAGPSWVAGHKPLAGVLDRLRITTNNGTDAFDAGAVSLLIEG
jgi:hypothetical protein